jgi:hypothetical protein
VRIAFPSFRLLELNVTITPSDNARILRDAISLAGSRTVGGLICCWLPLLVLVFSSGLAEAGCHYGTSSYVQFEMSPALPSGHVRHFRFMGQWIYESGTIKYVPWERSLPCDGPLCRQSDDQPPRQMATPSDLHRIRHSQVLVVVSHELPDSQRAWLNAEEDARLPETLVSLPDEPPRI